MNGRHVTLYFPAEDQPSTKALVQTNNIERAKQPNNVFLVSRDGDCMSPGAGLFPCHSSIIMAQCAAIREIEGPSEQDILPDGRRLLPIVRIDIPFPELFDEVEYYLYTHDEEKFLNRVLPGGWLLKHPAAWFIQWLVEHHDATVLDIALKAAIVYGFWRNICELGIFDAKIWHVIKYAWEVLTGILEINAKKSNVLLK
jgi:hypothetical protein